MEIPEQLLFDLMLAGDDVTKAVVRHHAARKAVIDYCNATIRPPKAA